MILEVANIRTDPANAALFESRVSEARPIFARAKGCKGLTLNRVIERPDCYQLRIVWETLEDHTVGFRESEDFKLWRGLVGEFFAEPPLVEHTEEIDLGSLG